MSLPSPSLNPENIHKLEDEILLVCRHCKTHQELVASAAHLWDWSAQTLKTSVEDLRSEIETHAQDEKFADAFSEEKDHLLKLPLILLEHYHHQNL